MDILKGLNDKQIEAVTAIDGNIRVTAGAGSGKTRVLAHRYAFLVNEVGISPSNILCMTFTNKAAQEMKKRISTMVHEGNVNDFVCTIHGFCVKFLREEIFRLGYPKNFAIIDSEDSKDLAKQVMSEFGLDKTVTTVKQFLENIRKSKYWSPYIEESMLPNSKLEGKDEFHSYLHLQLKTFALDFDDLILFTLYILNTHKDVQEKWQEKLNYIMVDEAQDCNGKDWELIELLRGDNHNLFFVGDPDQCIYEWRGASPDSFIKYKPDKDIILSQNYRSTPNILDVANSIISYNKNRIKKDLFTKKAKDRIVIHYHAPSEIDEGNWIATQIDNMVKAGARYSDFAILYRASYQSRFVEQAFLQKHIGYTIWGGIRFFERKEIKDALAYLRLLVYHDDISLRRIINVPSRKFGPQSMTKLMNTAEEDNTSLYDALTKHVRDFGKESLNAFVILYKNAADYKNKHSISDTLEFLIDKSGYKEMLRLDDDQERIDNLEELLSSIKYYEDTHKDDENLSIDNYLQDIALYTNADYKKETPTVKLMTIHQAKGLEFPYVFVCGLTEGVFPSHRSIRERKIKALEEERRLMYVAVTRAEKSLFLTESEGYNYVTKSDKYPSRFLNEIKESLIQVEGNIDHSLMEGTKRTIRDLENELKINQGLKFHVGSIVSNKYLGIGEVLSVNEEDKTCKVKFSNGVRNLSEWSLLTAKETALAKEKEIEKIAQEIPFLFLSEFSFCNIVKSNIGRKLKAKLSFERNVGYKVGTYRIPLILGVYKDENGNYYKAYFEENYEVREKFHIGCVVRSNGSYYQIARINQAYTNVSKNRYLLTSLKDGSKVEKNENEIEMILFAPIIGGFLKSPKTKEYFFLKSIDYDKKDTIFTVIDSERLKMHKLNVDMMVSKELKECSEETFLKHCCDRKKFHEKVKKMMKK